MSRLTNSSPIAERTPSSEQEPPCKSQLFKGGPSGLRDEHLGPIYKVEGAGCFVLVAGPSCYMIATTRRSIPSASARKPTHSATTSAWSTPLTDSCASLAASCTSSFSPVVLASTVSFIVLPSLFRRYIRNNRRSGSGAAYSISGEKAAWTGVLSYLRAIRREKSLPDFTPEYHLLAGSSIARRRLLGNEKGRIVS